MPKYIFLSSLLFPSSNYRRHFTSSSVLSRFYSCSVSFAIQRDLYFSFFFFFNRLLSHAVQHFTSALPLPHPIPSIACSFITPSPGMRSVFLPSSHLSPHNPLFPMHVYRPLQPCRNTIPDYFFDSTLPVPYLIYTVPSLMPKL